MMFITVHYGLDIALCQHETYRQAFLRPFGRVSHDQSRAATERHFEMRESFSFTNSIGPVIPDRKR
jgi:hypothetical protein